MNKLRIGIVGLGWVSQVFHLPLLSKFEDVEVVAVCDKDKSRARMIAERFNVHRVYTDYQQMLAKEDLEAIDVCTSTDAHLPITMASLEAGKDVFVEKPIARRYDEAVQMAEAAKHHKRKLMVGMNNRFRPDTLILKSFLEKGELGKIFYVKAGWLKKLSNDNPWITHKDKSGGGVFLDLGIVMLDLILWMMAFPPVARVNSKMYMHKTKSVEDSCIVFLEMKYGTSMMLETSWSFQSAEDFFYCDFFGSDGSAMINPLRIHKQLHGNLVNVTPAKTETPFNLFKKSYENELRHFVGAVRELHPVISTGDEAVHRMKVVDAIYRSAAKGKEIVLK
ncbi:MAG: Gfo/Idh/MocA family oxidoreductase [Ignavibacteria bacterium]|nr:Gfo/Idh/MocA family oxidoreductase [Ignavibacteria bacterium]MBI3766602.1 Gfo/Idh/MocA family oxidoreductase [Ignavibacteriales bacterium]